MEGRDPKASTRRARSAWTAPTAEHDSLTAPQPRRPSGHRPLRRSHPFSPGGRLHRAARTRALADGMESATTAARAQSTRTAPSGPTASTAARGLHVESTPPGLPLRPLPLRRRRRFSQMEAQGCAPTRVLLLGVPTTPTTTYTTLTAAFTVTAPSATTTLDPPMATTTQEATTASVRMAALVRSTQPALGAPTAPTVGNSVGLLHRHPLRRHRRLHLRRRRHHRHRHHRHRHHRHHHHRHRHVHLRHRRHHRRRHRRHRHRRHPHRHHLNHRRHPSRHRHDRRRRIRGSSASRRATPRGGRRAAPQTHGHANLGARPPQTRVLVALLMEPFTSLQRQTALRSGIPTISTMTGRPARAE